MISTNINKLVICKGCKKNFTPKVVTRLGKIQSQCDSCRFKNTKYYGLVNPELIIEKEIIELQSELLPILNEIDKSLYYNKYRNGTFKDSEIEKVHLKLIKKSENIKKKIEILRCTYLEISTNKLSLHK